MTIEAFTTFSEGTLQPADIAEALMPYAKRYLSQATVNDLQSVIDGEVAGEDFDDSLYNAFFELEGHIPPYCLIGSHPGDGACLGVWPDVGLALVDVRDGDLLQVSDTGDIPPDHVGLVLHVNDHGNVTLWEQVPGDSELVEHWAVV